MAVAVHRTILGQDASARRVIIAFYRGTAQNYIHLITNDAARIPLPATSVSISNQKPGSGLCARMINSTPPIARASGQAEKLFQHAPIRIGVGNAG